MVAAQPRKRRDEAPLTPKHTQRQSSTRSRSRSTRAENEGVGKVDWVEPSTDPQDPGAASGSSAHQAHTGEAVAVVSGGEGLKVGDRCWYGQETNTGKIEQLDSSGDALVKFAHGKSVWVSVKFCHSLTDAHILNVNLLEPGTLVKGQTLQGKECQGEFTKLSMSGMVMISSEAQFGKQRMLNPETLVRVEVAEPAKVSTELATFSTPEPELQSEAENCNSEPWFPTDEELAAWSVPNDTAATIASILEGCAFIRMGTDAEIYPDDEPESYRGWKLCTESPNGGMLAVDVLPPNSHWWSRATTEEFGYYDHDRAVEWLKRLIDRVIEATDRVSGQLSLPELFDRVQQGLIDEVQDEYEDDSDNNPPAINETGGESITTAEVSSFKVGDRVAVKYVPSKTWQGKDIRGKRTQFRNGDLGTIKEIDEGSCTVRLDGGGLLDFLPRHLEVVIPQPSTSTHQPISPSTLSHQPSTLPQLATDINRLHSDCEQAVAIAQSAQASALEHAKEAGLLLLQAKRVCGHGGWEKWREANLQLPSSTATLYQRVAEGWEVLTLCQDFESLTLKEAANRLKKPRLSDKSATDRQTVAEMRPVTHEKDLVETLQAAQADFHQRKAAAESRADNGSSIAQPLQQGDTLTTAEGDRTAEVLAVHPNGDLRLKWENDRTQVLTQRQIQKFDYRRAESPVNTPVELPNAVEAVESVTQHVWGLSEIHYAVRKFAAMNDRQWDEQMCDEVAAAVLDFLAEY